MNSDLAAYNTVHEHKGGSETLGPLVGVSPAVLRNKVNVNNTTHHLTFAEARRITDMTGDFRMLKAWAHESGFLLVKAPDTCTTECDMSVLEKMAGFMVACGSFGQEIHASLADGKVTKDEIEKVEGRAREVMTAAAEIKQRMEGMAE